MKIQGQDPVGALLSSFDSVAGAYRKVIERLAQTGDVTEAHRLVEGLGREVMVEAMKVWDAPSLGAEITGPLAEALGTSP